MAEGGPGATQDVVTALRAVPGVADASITPDRRLGGAGTLHLTLLPGADEVGVANAVNRVLREHFGLAVDTDNVAIVDEASPVRLSSVPAEPAPEPAQPMPYRGWPTAANNGGSHAVTEAKPEMKAEPKPGAEPEPRGAAPKAGSSAGAALSAVPGLVEDDLEVDEDADATADAADTEPTEVDLAARERAAAAAQPIRGPRLLIERMQLVAADLGVETEVTLGFSGEHWTGHADGAATPTAVHRAVAVATLDAIRQCVEGQMRLELEHLEVPALGSERAVVVEVSLVTRRGAERLTGVSAVRDDVRQAVIRATLDALNRRLESVLEPV